MAEQEEKQERLDAAAQAAYYHARSQMIGIILLPTWDNLPPDARKGMTEAIEESRKAYEKALPWHCHGCGGDFETELEFVMHER